MALAPMRICSAPGCSMLVRGGRCPQHSIQKAYDRQRGTATQRGYGSRWSAYRLRFLDEYPFCGDKPRAATATQDSLCAKVGLLVKATVVDHIVPVTGPDDPTFYRPECHQALCERCHNVKRQLEGMAAR